MRNISHTLILLSISMMLTSGCKQKTDTVSNRSLEQTQIDSKGRIYGEMLCNLDNKKARELCDKGKEMMLQSNPEEALKYFTKANIEYPNSSVILDFIGIANTRLHRYNDAEINFTTAIKLDSSYYASYINYGLMLYYANKYDKSIEILKLGLEKMSDARLIDACNFHLFMSYTGLSECDSAINYYEKAIKGTDNIELKENINEFKRNFFDPMSIQKGYLYKDINSRNQK